MTFHELWRIMTQLWRIMTQSWRNLKQLWRKCDARVTQNSTHDVKWKKITIIVFMYIARNGQAHEALRKSNLALHFNFYSYWKIPQDLSNMHTCSNKTGHEIQPVSALTLKTWARSGVAWERNKARKDFARPQPANSSQLWHQQTLLSTNYAKQFRSRGEKRDIDQFQLLQMVLNSCEQLK